ncbi:MAG: hypothetical protein HYY84_01490 [Deltaproteobacteria bacterium]|nr:hypothetical protein [Deltaproteobacteria bacterium]
MRVGALAIGLLAVLSAVEASAGDDADEMKRAEQEFTRGNWEKAADILRRAAPKLGGAARRAVAFKMLGLAEIERRQIAEAEAAFVQALTADPLIDVDPNEDTPKAVALFRGVRDRLDGRLSVTADQPAARLFIDGIEQGHLPTVVTVKIGKRRLRVATDDGRFVGELDNVIVHVGRLLKVVVKLKPRVAFPSVSGEEKRIDGTLERNAKRVIPPEARRSVPVVKSRKATRTLAIVALGVGALSAVVGAVLYWAPAAPEKSSMLAAEYEREKSSFNSSLNAGVVLMAAGGGLLASSGILFLVHREQVLRDKQGRFAPRGGTGVSVAFRF